MWLTTVMEVLFAGAVAALAVDLGARWLGRRRSLSVALVSCAAIIGALAMVVSDWPQPGGGVVPVQPVASALASLYTVDRFSSFMALTVLVVGLVSSVFAWRQLGPKANHGPFFGLLLLLLGSLVGVVSAGDYLSLFLFWEGMSVAAYALVSFARSQLSLEASIKYFFMAGIGSLMALYGIAVIYSATGSLQLGSVGALVASGSQTVTFGIALVIVGLGVEAAIVPMHTWLPDVYSTASLPSTSVISGAVTGTGVFAILKVVQPLVPGGGFLVAALSAGSSLPSIQYLIASLALITMFVGNLSGLFQTNLRRILSFSSIAQTGYMLAALATMSVPGLVAVVFTAWNNGLLKSSFFMLLGRQGSAMESADLKNLEGMGRRNRPLGFLYASSALAMMGAPPFGMFWSEILVVLALLSAKTALFFWLGVAVVGNILVSIGYYYKIINSIVFGKSETPPEKGTYADLVPSAALLSLSLITGVIPFLLLNALA